MTTPESRLARAEAVLGGHEIDVPAGAKVRVRQQVFEGPRRPRITWAHAAMACAACAAVVFMKFAPLNPAPRASAGSPSPWLAAGNAHQVGPATVRPRPGARVQLTNIGGLPVVRVWRGEVEVTMPTLATPQFVEVQTMHGRIQCLGGRFRVEASSQQSLLTVQEGTVSVITDPRASPTSLRAGRRVRLSPKAPPAAPPATAHASAPVTRRAPSPAPTAPRVAPSPQEDLQSARRWLPKDANRAGDLAERVVEARPDAPIELQALFVLADARRRAGRNAEASDVYARVLAHPEGAAFQEEAHFQRAHLLHQMGRLSQAEHELQTAHAAHRAGPLAPERGALMALMRMKGGDLDGAARALEQVPPGGWSRVLDERRIQVAEALLRAEPQRAAALAIQVAQSGRAPDLIVMAKKVLAEARKREGVSPSRPPMVEP